MTEEENKNTLGAIIFFIYIIAALVLTCILLNDLNLPSASSTRPRRHASQSTKRRQHGATNQESTRPWLFAALSATSFAALSYHMLNFLLESYRVWSTTKLMDFKVRPRHIWTWSTESRLFREFGEVICNDPRRFWWTRSALVYSFGWNLYMSIEGTRLQVPHLGVYFLLNQILPVSFTQNLFLFRTSVLGRADSDTDLTPTRLTVHPASAFRQGASTLSYLFVLALAPYSVGTRYFFPVLFATRVLLFAGPYIILRPELGKDQLNPSTTTTTTTTTKYHTVKLYRWSCAILAVSLGYMSMQTIQTARSSTDGLAAIGNALHDSPAVSALGYDVMIGMVSLACVFGGW
ncbi:hypothetical protein H2204_011556 [Knufia peltigerae]|uniref:Uncharacterized protein n=1 Tax=Knufia peltigerae TaxID=1002370 RepID=A0AA39CT57_9EURO|nr:hypothetical protein H2204_011556 [Knufia peltigerae]